MVREGKLGGEIADEVYPCYLTLLLEGFLYAGGC